MEESEPGRHFFENEIVEKLKNAPAKPFSVDMCTPSNGHLLKISYSLIDVNFKIHNGQFQMIHFTEKHTRTNIIQKLQD